MIAFINRYTTPLTVWLFAVSAISGLALWVDASPRTFHAMHEWLSVVFLVPVGLHLWKNWSTFVGYLRNRALTLSLIAVVAVAVPFAIFATEGDDDEQNSAAVHLITQSSLSDLASILKITPQNLVANLRHHGYRVRSAMISLDTVAEDNGIKASDVLAVVVPVN